MCIYLVLFPLAGSNRELSCLICVHCVFCAVDSYEIILSIFYWFKGVFRWNFFVCFQCIIFIFGRLSCLAAPGGTYTLLLVEHVPLLCFLRFGDMFVHIIDIYESPRDVVSLAYFLETCCLGWESHGCTEIPYCTSNDW